ncbi:bZIP transcription factor [Musa troglodytarum]|uniref:BZIP transcription factor n=1 Tax=Musa troglodytarum TaxID=320322 RepID=A0A9E7F157_9LILI|nr:bZIP transcription factor [Musa troglodytarum]
MVSSSSRASSSNSPLLISQTPRRTMEKVWKDITVTTLNRERPITPLEHHGYGRHHHHANSLPSFRDMMLQDFLAGPLSRPPTISPSAVEHLRPDPKTHSDSTSSSHNASIISSVMAGPPSPTGLFTFRSRKQRLRENPTVGVDRRLQRLIKNRESAARSRARKQAYTNELELEVSHLKEENAKLKKQYVELRLAMNNQLPKRNTLKRSCSASF